MRILVLSDSHASLSFMRYCVDALLPDMILHLGDYYDDGQEIHEEYPDVDFYQVPGNCDVYRCPPGAAEIQIVSAEGVRLYLTHGHRHRVKMDTGRLLASAREARVDAVLYGHTHEAECYQESDGLWVMNPGSCGYYGGSAGLIEIENREIVDCRILRQRDLEGIV